MELGETLLLLLVVCISTFILLSSWSQIARRRQLPPGPAPLPILGNLLELKAHDMLRSFKKLRDQYGPVFTIHLGHRRVVVLYGYKAVKEALVDHAEEFSGRGHLATVDDFVQGFGIAFANGERWKQLRRFTLSTLRNFGMGKRSIEERIQEEAQFLVEEFRKTHGSAFDPTFILSRSVSNVICSTVFGQRFDYEDKDFLSLLTKINENFVLMSATWGQESKNPLSEFHLKTMIMTVLNLFIAGTETVSSTLRFGFLILMKYPEVQAKVAQEIDDVIGRSRVPKVEDRTQMPYTDAVIHEIQRFGDVIPMNLPHAVTRTMQFRGYTLPKGIDVLPLLTSVLRDPDCFSDPENFNPGHFLDEKGHFKKSDAFIPFSTGRRICAGEGLARMELFLYLTSILQHFALTSPVDPMDLDLTPPVSGFANIPPTYPLCAIPR
ncbi:cytochrome P450 2A13-like isoform X5 [Elgaria multicarinata webbii]|uniref:cytochrome P450 2A13-like isoform X5 n=1 Tax=Elgaria multicarinata webbii TaxID=159646 RepID=UPI002FCCFB9C